MVVLKAPIPLNDSLKPVNENWIRSLIKDLNFNRYKGSAQIDGSSWTT